MKELLAIAILVPLSLACEETAMHHGPHSELDPLLLPVSVARVGNADFSHQNILDMIARTTAIAEGLMFPSEQRVGNGFHTNAVSSFFLITS